MVQRSGFVVSSGRTGTSFLTHLINKHVENAYSLTEPKPAFRRRGLKILRRDPYWFERLYCQGFRLARHLGHDEHWYIETNHKLYSLLPYLREWYRDPPIIHVVRDGREVVRSWINYGRFMSVNDKTLKLLPNLADEDEPIRKLWSDWNPIQRAAWYWAHKVTVIDRAEPDLTIRFRDMVDREDPEVFRLLNQFEGISYREEDIRHELKNKTNRSTSNFITEFASWPDHWKRQFHDLAGKAMDRFAFD
jgi:hypothetical protein